MRIILVQAEIEAALRAYVFSQINVAEGQDITIDFKNTRGEDGATAEINITKAAAPNEQPQETTQTATQRRQPAAATQTAQMTTKPSTASPAPAATATQPTSSEPEQSAADVSSTTENTETASTEAEVVEEPAVAEEPVKEEAPVEPVKKPSFLQPAVSAETPDVPAASAGKSLFANLTKPVNPKPDAA